MGREIMRYITLTIEQAQCGKANSPLLLVNNSNTLKS